MRTRSSIGPDGKGDSLLERLTQDLAEVRNLQQTKKSLQTQLVELQAAYRTAHEMGVALQKENETQLTRIETLLKENEKLNAERTIAAQSHAMLSRPRDSPFAGKNCPLVSGPVPFGQAAPIAYMGGPFLDDASLSNHNDQETLFVSEGEEDVPLSRSQRATDVPRPKQRDHYYSSKTTKEAWEELEPARRVTLSHVGRIEETQCGIRAEAACERCTARSFKCMVYSETARKRYHDGSEGYNCARCRFSGASCSIQQGACPQSHNKPPKAAQMRTYAIREQATATKRTLLPEEVTAIQEENTELKARLAMDDKRADAYKGRVEQLQSEIKTLKQRCMAEQNEVLIKNTSVGVLVNAKDRVLRQLRECERTTQREKQARVDCNMSLERSEKRLVDMRSAIAECKAEILSLRDQKTELERTVAELRCKSCDSRAQDDAPKMGEVSRRHDMGGEQLVHTYGGEVRDCVYRLGTLVKDADVKVAGIVVPCGFRKLSQSEDDVGLGLGLDTLEVIKAAGTVVGPHELMPWKLSLHREGAEVQDASAEGAWFDVQMPVPVESEANEPNENRDGPRHISGREPELPAPGPPLINDILPVKEPTVSVTDTISCSYTSHASSEGRASISPSEKTSSSALELMGSNPPRGPLCDGSKRSPSSMKRYWNGQIHDPCLRAHKRARTYRHPSAHQLYDSCRPTAPWMFQARNGLRIPQTRGKLGEGTSTFDQRLPTKRVPGR